MSSTEIVNDKFIDSVVQRRGNKRRKQTSNPKGTNSDLTNIKDQSLTKNLDIFIFKLETISDTPFPVVEDVKRMEVSQRICGLKKTLKINISSYRRPRKIYDENLKKVLECLEARRPILSSLPRYIPENIIPIVIVLSVTRELERPSLVITYFINLQNKMNLSPKLNSSNSFYIWYIADGSETIEVRYKDNSRYYHTFESRKGRRGGNSERKRNRNLDEESFISKTSLIKLEKDLVEVPFYEMLILEFASDFCSGMINYKLDNSIGTNCCLELYNTYGEQVLHTTNRTVVKNKPHWFCRIKQYALEFELVKNHSYLLT
ncbi:hypothetical protein Glove_853g15 [Diversispora epigaea]|uniref:Uncharacterized protein n=1 Tax=Diversispora epigaea TaxID=1348612 RepID=A0A397G4L8_9GLOM|nr:hypothetical protein Glove_853g15 [Diversispora epigaea]